MQSKLLDKLTISDLQAIPIWRYWSETDDEAAWVEATELTYLSEESDLTFLAATEFVLADGTRHLGYCSPVDWSGLDYVQPVLLTPHGVVRLWLASSPDQTLFERQFAILRKPLSSIFPLVYRCIVPVSGHYRTGYVQDLQQLIRGIL
jgi:hypothetical protein